MQESPNFFREEKSLSLALPDVLQVSRTNESRDLTHQSSWAAAEAVLGGKFIAIHTYMKKKGKIANK